MRNIIINVIAFILTLFLLLYMGISMIVGGGFIIASVFGLQLFIGVLWNCGGILIITILAAVLDVLTYLD